MPADNACSNRTIHRDLVVGVIVNVRPIRRVQPLQQIDGAISRSGGAIDRFADVLISCGDIFNEFCRRIGLPRGTLKIDDNGL
jgi:hypothetical protein